MKYIDFKSNKGVSTVLFALMMTSIMALGALVIDIGRVYAENTHMQNAIDAACLAATADLPDKTKATATAKKYMQLNGYQPTDITVTFTDSDKTINIKGNKKVEFTLAKVLGFNSMDVTPSAAAQGGAQIPAAFNYAIFSGSTDQALQFYGEHLYVDGNIHANAAFRHYTNYTTVTGAVEGTTLDIQGQNINIPMANRIPGAPYIPMPDFSDTIKAQAQAAGTYYTGWKEFNGNTINLNSPIYVDGGVAFNASKFNGTGYIFATGDIAFNMDNSSCTNTSSICYYSKNGNIRISGSNTLIYGMVYAPNGSIDIYGNYNTVYGRVIGKTVNIYGHDCKVIASGNDLRFLPSSSVKLTQ